MTGLLLFSPWCCNQIITNLITSNSLNVINPTYGRMMDRIHKSLLLEPLATVKPVQAGILHKAHRNDIPHRIVYYLQCCHISGLRKWGVMCQKQLSRAWFSFYIPMILEFYNFISIAKMICHMFRSIQWVLYHTLYKWHATLMPIYFNDHTHALQLCVEYRSR